MLAFSFSIEAWFDVADSTFQQIKSTSDVVHYSQCILKRQIRKALFLHISSKAKIGLLLEVTIRFSAGHSPRKSSYASLPSDLTRLAAAVAAEQDSA